MFSFKVHVHGVDLSTNMVAIAQDYRVTMEPEVTHRWVNNMYSNPLLFKKLT